MTLKIQNQNYFFSVIGLTAITLLLSCKKDKLITDSSAKLEFSAQTILFDTVFTTVGSVTKYFIVYNRHTQPINISSIRLAGGDVSNFRINVDGSKGIFFTNVEIAAKDSIFVFAEVTVDPNNSTNPLIIRDSVVFETNGNIQDVDMEAWGQDAYFHTPNKTLVFPDGSGLNYSIIAGVNQTVTWTNDKPHVIYGYAVIDSAGTLNMNPGTKVYMHPGSVLWVYKDGTLKINGTQTQRVTIQGDRLEPVYAEAAGQWGYIWLSKESKNNKIDWAIIKNGFIGILSDTVNTWNNPTLELNNTIIKNMSVTALYARGSFIKGSNCVFANCGQYVAAFAIGGRYNFYHCTFANYWDNGTRQFPTLLINNYYKDVNEIIHPRPLDSAYFYNCIVYGDISSGNELKLDSVNTASFNYKFHHCLLKTNFSTTGANYVNVIVNKDPYFRNPSSNDYHILALGYDAVIKKADTAIANLFPFDLDGISRIVPNGSTPTIGAYEYVP